MYTLEDVESNKDIFVERSVMYSHDKFVNNIILHLISKLLNC